MSERKSWDIAPKQRVQPARRPTPSPQRPVHAPRASRSTAVRSAKPVDMVRPARASSARVAAPVSRTPARPAAVPRAARPAAPRMRQRASSQRTAPQGRLRDRRKKAQATTRMTILAACGVLFVTLAAALWIPQLRVQEVVASGPNADAIEEIAQAQLAGTQLLVLPNDSMLLLPRGTIRDAVLARFPEIADVTVARSSFSSLELTPVPRGKAFVWCGTSFATPFPDGTCFEADGGGLIYRAADAIRVTASTVDSTIDAPAAAPVVPDTETLMIYGQLEAELEEGAWPIGVRVSQAGALPDVLRFVDAVRSLGVPVIAITLRGDESDLWVNDATRVTYVIGREESAAKLAASVIPTLSLTDRSIQYLDLRFNGKAYLKRYEE